LALKGKQEATGLKKYIYSTYSPLSSRHLCLRCSNFFNPYKKNSFGCAANRRIRNRKSQKLISTATYSQAYAYSFSIISDFFKIIYVGKRGDFRLALPFNLSNDMVSICQASASSSFSDVYRYVIIRKALDYELPVFIRSFIQWLYSPLLGPGPLFSVS
jgi:hypothetical protein